MGSWPGAEIGLGGELRSVPGLGLFGEAGARLSLSTNRNAPSSVFFSFGVQLWFDDL